MPFQFVKADLKLAVDQVKIEPGSLVVVRPKNRHTTFTPEYCTWLSENLVDLLPPGTKAVILNDDSTTIIPLEPNPPRDVEAYGADMGEAYEKGWRDAFEALERACS